MDYFEAIQYMEKHLPMYHRVGEKAYKPGLNNALELDNYFGNDHHKFKSIHVAGTNGKGSVSSLLASVLQEAGYKVGLFTSPHLLDYTERIRINGVCIEKDFVAQFIENNKDFFDKLQPSFYEMTVFLAFRWFSLNNIDIAIVEVGLGGRLDTTNIIQPLLSVITNIGYDHMHLLGNTLPEIAIEKAGIIKDNIPVVIGEYSDSEVKSVFINIANLHKASIYFSEEITTVQYIEAKDNYSMFKVDKSKLFIPTIIECQLLASYQKKNIQTLLTALHVISTSFSFNTDQILNGCKKVIDNVDLKGRWQILKSKPLIIADIAHNEQGFDQLFEHLKTLEYDRLLFVLGFVADKNVDSILAKLPKQACYFFTRPSVERGMDEKQLQRMAMKYGLFGNAYPEFAKAIDSTSKCRRDNSLTLITGSNFLVADALKIF